MTCCGSSILPVAVTPAAHAPSTTAGAADAMQAILFSEILKPLTAALGPVGDAATGSVVRQLFMRPQP